jgi:hypothetical protein
VELYFAIPLQIILMVFGPTFPAGSMIQRSQCNAKKYVQVREAKRTNH